MPFDPIKWDNSHSKRSEQYARAIDQLYNKAVNDIARLAAGLKVDPDKPFSFSDYPRLQGQVNQVIETLAVRVGAVVAKGTRDEWLYACKKNDAFLQSILNTSQVAKEHLKSMQDYNLDALKAFQVRKARGMGLSDKVWKYADQFKGSMELGIDVAIGEGTSAQILSKELKQYLRNPDKLFRRVRDKRGVLHLSKAAKNYHPGQGVYRSAHQNAMRLARTEVNMAYCASEQKRWDRLDFVVGYEVRLSNNHTLNGKPFVDICDELAGKYPKWFIFRGWHPNCRCHAVPVLMSPDEFDTDELNELRAAIKGDKYKRFASRNQVNDVPDNFKKWIADNADRSKNWSSQPYFIRDNFKKGKIAGGLKVVPKVDPKPAKSQPQVNQLYEILKQSEDKIRSLRSFERALIYDKDGNKVFEKDGGQRSVSFSGVDPGLFKDKILTHNHPLGWKAREGSIGRIGSSFSAADVLTSINYDFLEVRAVTPVMTFYMKRPSAGWPNIDQAKAAISEIESNIYAENMARINKGTTTISKAEVTHYHEIWKRFAKRFNIEYGKY